MATKTSNTYAPLEYFTAGQAAMFAIPSRSILGTYVKFGKNDKGETIFQYIDPDTPHTQNVYEKDAKGNYKWDANGRLIPVLNPDGTQKTQIARYSDGTPITNKTELARNGDALAISDDGRSLMSTMTGGQRSLSGMSEGMGYTLNGSGMDETLSFSGNNGWVSGKFSTPTYGVANIPAEGVSQYKLAEDYQKYLYGFAGLAKGVQSRITSKTVTDEGILGDIKDTIGQLGPLAPIALSFALPGIGTAIGSALGVTGAAAGIVGNTLVNAALNGGDVGKALSSSLIGATGIEAGTLAGEIAKGGELGTFLQNNPQYLSNLANNVTQTALKGGDVESVLGNTLFGTGVSMATSQIPGYSDLAPTVKASVDAAVTGALQGKDVTAAAINAAIKAGQSAMATSTNVPTEAEALKQQQDLQAQLAGHEDATAAQNADTTPVTPAPSTTDFPVQDLGITPESMASFQQTLSDNFQGSQWKPGEGGDYTLTGDDGSTITMHKDGTTTATAAPTENLLDAIGKETTGGTTSATGGGGTTAAGGASGTGAQQTQPTSAATEAAPKGLSVNQLQSLYSLFEGDGATAAPQATEQAAAGPQTYAPPKEASFLGELGERPRYLDAIDPETLQLMQQLGIDPAELMAQQEAEGGAEEMGEHGEEGEDVLSAPKGAGYASTRSGIQRGLRPGTLSLAGPEVGEAYKAARANPMSMSDVPGYRLPIDDYSKSAYLKQLAKEAEGALSSEWQPLIGGKQLTLSGVPSARADVGGDPTAYIPKLNIAGSPFYKGTTAPQLIAMVGADPELLNDPEYLASVMSHELSHRPYYANKSLEERVSPITDMYGQLGYQPGRAVEQARAFSQDIAKALPDLTQRLGYQGFYDTKANAALDERLADLHGWATQNNINLARDPVFAQTALNSPERMAVFNAMSPQRAIAWNPGEAEVGKISLEDFRDMPAPLSWAYKNLNKDQLLKQLQIRKRMSGMFGQ